MAHTQVLLEHHAKVYIAGRSKEKGAAAIDKLFHETGNGKAEFIQLDLTDSTSVIAAAKLLKSKESKLHLLFNNAFIYTFEVG